jgi:predicted O-methyltransferase YrrM
LRVKVDNVDLPNWFDYVKSNFSLLSRDVELLVLQIGVYKGDCTEYILENCRVKRIVDVDTWEGSMEHPDLNIIFDAVEEVYDRKFSDDKRVKKMKMTSDLYFANNFPEEKFDFIYIDGAHTSTQVLVDAVNAFPRLKVGGILAFDDYEWLAYPGTLNNPKSGIDCWLTLFNGYYEFIVQNYQIWVKKLKEV